MDFNEVFINALISTFSGIAGGLGVYWFHKSIQFLDGELRFNNKSPMGRYFLKFSFIALFLFFIAAIISILIYLFFFYKLSFSPLIVSILALITGIVLILISLFKWKKT